jgi:hypothetical protein
VKPRAKPAAATAPRAGFTFELAPLTRYRPEGIIAKVGQDRVQMLVLALALAFNDLKGLLLWQEATSGSHIPTGEISGKEGEWAGMLLQIRRLQFGHLHELLELIRVFEAEAKSGEIQSIVDRAPRITKDEWLGLVRIATKSGTSRDAKIRAILVQTRNNSAYHYAQPKAVVAGFRTHFFDSPQDERAKFAFASLGTDMARTRFYFADAAVEGALNDLVATMGLKKVNKRLRETIDAVNHALEYIVSGYIERAKVI